MYTTNTSTLATIALIAAAVVVMAVLAIAARRRSMRSAELRRRFGPEYDQAIRELGGRSRAERELAARARRVEHLQFHELSDADRLRFQSAWSQIQGKFVDDPAAAAVGANELIKEVMRARGYPTDDFEHRLGDLSVNHPDVVQHYRAARALSGSIGEPEVDTEDLRQALVHYRVLFADLILESGAGPESFRAAHA